MGKPAATEAEIEARIIVTDLLWNGTPCWRWSGTHRKSDGRPILNKKYVYRIVYVMKRGAIPTGKGNTLHHECEHKWCINPWHDKSLKQSAHMKEHGLGGDWGQADKTECANGHAYNETNTYIFQRSDGGFERHCRECRKLATRKYRERIL